MLLASIASAIAAPATSIEAFHSCIGQSMDANLITPVSPLFNPIAVGSRARIERHPAGVLLASSEEEVIKALECAVSLNLQPVVRAGGHSYENLSSQDGAIVIDIAAINYVKLKAENPETQTAAFVVGGGTRLGNVYDQLYQNGEYTFNAGTCPSVGIGGHISGGGYGMSARSKGLAADRVLEMRVVLYNGTVVEANMDKHPDLFWALRGGGSGSFGIVTEYTIDAFKSPSNVLFSIKWDGQFAKQLFKHWMNYFPKADERLTYQFELHPAMVAFHGQFHGSESEFDKLMDDSGIYKSNYTILHNDKRTCNALGAKAYIDSRDCDNIQALRAPVRVTDTYKDYGKYKSDYFDRVLDDEGINAVVDGIQRAPKGSWIQMEGLGGYIGSLSNDLLPYNHRDALFQVQYQVPLDKNATKDHPNYRWILEYEAAMKPFTNGQHYQNYCDLDIGADYGRAYWGERNFDRLKEIKKKYDPMNVFRNEQSIPVQ